ncbi:hypothetical protein IGI04_006804 [Brassica rapa subsp. trilocularis]|uniref:Uncharacterized protein n=1 Tax=Brassica rapa subsp. trilocularis TaxID=1813537 RepID=A0ABQ7NKC8_BRACM|nr:hypothetical protein IGI04_006804 [Brassica rapa subsp. trilocularis]
MKLRRRMRSLQRDEALRQGIKSSGETRVSVIRYGGLVRRRRSGRGGAMRGAMTVRISTRVSFQPRRRTRT